MILADNEAGRRAALAKLLPMQRADFVELFEIMQRAAGDASACSTRRCTSSCRRRRRRSPRSPTAMGVDAEKLRERTHGAARVQPDARPSRLPARHLLSRDRRDAGARHLRGGGRGRPPRPASRSMPEIMVPLVAVKAELDLVKALIDAAAAAVAAGARREAATISVGTMIELPRAALARRRDRRVRRVLLLRHQRPDPDDLRHLARRRGDVPRRLHVARASSPATRSSRSTARASASWSRSRPSAGAKTRPDIKLGICGEHGGDPASIAFCEEVGLDYVSCSPFRVPIARLAAAQAALKAKGGPGGGAKTD